MSRPDPGAQSRRLFTPHMWSFSVWKRVLSFPSPLCFSPSLAFTSSTQLPAGAGRRLGQSPLGREKSSPLQVLSRGCPSARHHPSSSVHPINLWRTHRLRGRGCRKTEPSVPHSVLFSARRDTWHEWVHFCGALAEGTQRADQASGLDQALGWGWRVIQSLLLVSIKCFLGWEFFCWLQIRL